LSHFEEDMTPFETFNPSNEKNSNSSSQEFEDGPEVHFQPNPDDQTPAPQ